MQLSRGGVEALRTVLHHQRLGICFEVQIPLGIPRCTALGATMAYSPSCSTRINGNFLILPVLRARVVKITTGRRVPASVLASRPSVAS
jgi:hypothetical protein